MAARSNPLPLVGQAPFAAMPGLISPEVGTTVTPYIAAGNFFNTKMTTVGVTYSEANLRATFTVTGTIIWQTVARSATGIPIATEVQVITVADTTTRIGVQAIADTNPGGNWPGNTGQIGYYSDGQLVIAGSSTASWGPTYTTGDYISYSLFGGQLRFYKNGALVGIAASGLTGAYIGAMASNGAVAFTDARISTVFTYPIGGFFVWR